MKLYSIKWWNIIGKWAMPTILFITKLTKSPYTTSRYAIVAATHSLQQLNFSIDWNFCTRSTSGCTNTLTTLRLQEHWIWKIWQNARSMEATNFPWQSSTSLVCTFLLYTFVFLHKPFHTSSPTLPGNHSNKHQQPYEVQSWAVCLLLAL